MPAQYTHRILAETVLRSLPNNVRGKISCLPAYYLGAQGADILYFLHLRRGREKNLGSYFHNIGVYEGFCSLLSSARESAFAFSYAAGFITHYAADTVFHPFVYGMIEKFNDYEPDWRGRRHSYIENDLDSYFVQKYRNRAAYRCCRAARRAEPYVQRLRAAFRFRARSARRTRPFFPFQPLFYGRKSAPPQFFRRGRARTARSASVFFHVSPPRFRRALPEPVARRMAQPVLARISFARKCRRFVCACGGGMPAAAFGIFCCRSRGKSAFFRKFRQEPFDGRARRGASRASPCGRKKPQRSGKHG